MSASSVRYGFESFLPSDSTLSSFTLLPNYHVELNYSLRLLFDNDMTSLELELLSSLPSLAALYE
jgi:hypothetical protein